MKSATSRSGVAVRRILVLKVAGAVAWMALGGCADVDIHTPDWTWDGDFGEVRTTKHSAEVSFLFDEGAAQELSLTGVAGTVEIVGQPGISGIVVEGQRRVRSNSRADAQAHLGDLAVEVRRSGGTLLVETRQPQRSYGRSYEVDYRISLPQGTKVTVVHVAGSVEVRTVNGDVDVSAVAGMLRFANLTANLRGTVSAGGVDADVALPPGGRLELRSGAGNIHLRLPAQTSASVWASAAAGSVHWSGLGLVDTDPRAAVLEGTLADGNGTVRLQAGAGNITLEGR